MSQRDIVHHAGGEPPALRRRGNPRKALGIRVRWALLGFVGPFILKKYLRAAITNI
jgi:hypothetical protein